MHNKRGKKITMRALIFVAPGKIELAEKPLPEVGPTDALIRITTTTICGTDVHIVNGVVEELGAAVTGYRGVDVAIEALGPQFARMAKNACDA